MYILKFVDSRRILVLLYGLLAAHIMNFVLQFANTLLISSFFLAATVSAIVIVNMEKNIAKIPYTVAVWLGKTTILLQQLFQN